MDSFFSLLYPDAKSKETETVVEQETAEDLGFDDVKIPFKNTERYYSKHKQQLNKILTLEHAISYRQEVLLDFQSIPSLREEINRFLPEIHRCIREYEEYRSMQQDEIRDGLWKTELFNLYSECLTRLSDILERHELQIRSQGLRSLKEYVRNIQKQPEYIEAVEFLPTIRKKVKDTGTFSLNVLFNAEYRPLFTTVVKSHNEEEDPLTLARALFGPEEGKRYAFSVLSHSVPGIRTLYNQTFRSEMEAVFKDLDPILNAYSEKDFLVLCDLDYGFDFYLAALKFIEYWKEKDIPICMPKVCSMEENIGIVHEMTDLGLVMRMTKSGVDSKTAVKNQAVFDDTGRIHILTGINKGGKTTYVRGIGCLWLLFQNGLPVPGSFARMSPVRKIFTHFPKEEEKVYGQGHLGKELNKLKNILMQAEEGDLVLLNESLSSTGKDDSLAICTDFIKILSELGVKSVFATHLHPLAFGWEERNLCASVKSKVDSWTAGVETEQINGVKNHKATYKIEKGLPDGESYADEIVRRYGLSYNPTGHGDYFSEHKLVRNDSFSLLYQDFHIETEITEKTLSDIGMDSLIEFASNTDRSYAGFLKYLNRIPADRENISYRQEIFYELMANEAMAEDFIKWIEEVAAFEEHIRDKYNRLPDHRRRIRWKIRSLDRYISCLESLLQILNRSDIRSEGLLRLKEFVREMHDQKEVSNLKELLPKLEKEIVGMRNLKIQVRFNAKLEPDEMELYNVGFLKLPKESQADIIKTVSPKPPAGKRPLADRFYRAVLEVPVLMRAFKPKPEAFNQDAVFLNDVKRYIDQSLQQLSDGMDSYITEHGGNLLRLASEIQFYTAAYRFTKDLMKLGAPMCRPKITEDNTKIQGLWDIATALYLFQENKGDTLVLNDIDFSEGKRVFILTGPNGGGKTTFLKAIGTAQVFFQGGLYVPAEYAEMAPVGNLATHFLKRENKVFGEGRLGEELKELTALLGVLSSKDMLLMNESVSSASAYDGFIIACHVIKGLRDKGVKTVYSTHLHELSKESDSLNEKSDSPYKIVSLTAGVKEALLSGEKTYERTFKIKEGKADGRSFAADIAREQGMTYEGMKELLRSRKKECVI
jgi:DNA mismatch repair protein MutS